MPARTHLVIASLFLAFLIGWWFVEHGPSPAAAGTDASTVAKPQPQTISQAEIQRQFTAMQQDQQSAAAELARRDAARGLRARAEAKTVEYRKVLQIDFADEWTSFLRDHWQTYKDLRARAAASRDGKTPCTICDGHGLMDSCFLCGSTGMCPTCKGTGKLSLTSDELCPTCLGSGKCYRCAGTGKMVCPFCDDGIVDIHAAPPPNLLPLDMSHGSVPPLRKN